MVAVRLRYKYSGPDSVYHKLHQRMNPLTKTLATRFTAKIPGRITADDSSLSFYASSTSSDVRTILPRDTSGFAVFLWEGDVTGQRMDVFPAKVTTESVDGNMEDPQQVNIGFAITKIPALNVVIP